MNIKSLRFSAGALCLAAAFTMPAFAGFTSPSQLAGTYSMKYYDFKDSNSPTISYNGNSEDDTYFELKPGESDTQVFISDFFFIYGMDIPATVDWEAGTITIPSVEKVAFLMNYDGHANVTFYSWNNTHTRYSKLDEVTATFLKNGTGSFVFDDNIFMTIIVPDGINPTNGSDVRGEQIIFAGGSYEGDNLFAQATKHNWCYFPEEWKFSGVADFTDGWIAPLAGYNGPTGEQLTYKRDYYQNIENPSIYMIMDPYGEGTIWKDAAVVGDEMLNTYSGPGYIYIDATEEDFVRVLGGVPAGFTCARKEPTEKDSLGQSIDHQIADFGCMNEEGYYTWHSGMFRRYIESIMKSYGMYNYSTLEGNLLTINNLDYTLATDDYSWRESDKYISTFVLHEGEESVDAAVDAILVDAEGEAEYFNLQGQRIVSPQAGQIVICRKGSKTTKQIVK